MKNDNKIINLQDKIKAKKLLLEQGMTRFTPKTNCILECSALNLKVNLHVMKQNNLKILAIKLNSYLISMKQLEIKEVLIGDYDITIWMDDILSKIALNELSNEKKLLNDYELQLSNLLSSDKKTELAIDNISKLLD